MFGKKDIPGIAIVVILALAFLSSPAYAKPIGADAAPHECCATTDWDTSPVGGACFCPDQPGGSFISTSNGTMGESYPVVSARSANGAGLELSLRYTSYNADGEKASLATVLGFGWSHSYNVFLFAQGMDIFKMSPGGLVTKYQRTGRSGHSLILERAGMPSKDGMGIQLIKKDANYLNFVTSLITKH